MVPFTHGGSDPELRAESIPGWSQRTQDLLSGYAQQVFTLLASDPKFVDYGLDVLNSAVNVYYAGTRPTSVAAFEAEALTAGVHLNWISTRFTTAQLDAASLALGDALRRAEIVWHRISQPHESGGGASGLTVRVPAVSAEVEARITSIASEIAPGIPVLVTKSGGPTRTNGKVPR